tara:strand:+ start:337 stop:1167 length:831 start_codon:yes stop_codon:yes gene_type:complete
MPHVKPKSLHPQRGTGYHGSFLGIADGAIAANDIVVASGYSGERIKFKKADANATPLASGVMGIADHAVASGGSVRVVSHKLITGVNTSDSTAAGYPVYLSTTAGGWSVTPTGPIVGTVLSDHASTGAVALSITHTANDSLSGTAFGAATSLINGGANDTEILLIQPAGTMLTDAGCVLTTAIAGSSGTTAVKFGTASDGAQICAAANFISSATAGAIGSAITVGGAQGEAAAALTFVANAALWTATERTIYFRAEADAAITAGVMRPFIKFMNVS